MIPNLFPHLPTYASYAFPIVAGSGDQVRDSEGDTYLDFYGEHCMVGTEHYHPTVVGAIGEQAQKLIFYSATACLPVRRKAAAALVAFAGAGMASVFFCNSGAKANENALRIAVKLTGRRNFVAFHGAFHGRTLLALSVTDSPALHEGYEALFAPTTFFPLGDHEELEAVDFSDVATVIVEPIQSKVGVRTATPALFSALRDRCRRSGTLLIFDKIQTVIGRLGIPIVTNLYAVSPDMMTCTKGLASGIPMGDPPARIRAINAHIRSGIEVIVRHVCGAGLLLGLKVGEQAAALKAYLVDRHILIGGLDDPGVRRLMLLLNISNAAIDALLSAVNEFAAREAVA